MQSGTDRTHPGFTHLGTFETALANTVSKPRWIIYVATSAVVLLAWFWLTYLAAGVSQSTGAQPLGPGMNLWGDLFGVFGEDAFQSPWMAFFLELCTPQQTASLGFASFAMMFSMWFLMSLAMMLPSAAPLIRTYADISDVAAGKGDHAVPLYILILGYLLIWAGFALTATSLQIAFISTRLIADPTLPIGGMLGALVLLLAGAYQFSALKEACLKKCRNPFTTLFAQWTTDRSGVFKLGIQQGIFCLGCCWALMLVMLVVGIMNLTWMAFLTLFAIIEKSGSGKVTSRVTGGILLIWGGILFALSIV